MRASMIQPASVHSSQVSFKACGGILSLSFVYFAFSLKCLFHFFSWFSQESQRAVIRPHCQKHVSLWVDVKCTLEVWCHISLFPISPLALTGRHKLSMTKVHNAVFCSYFKLVAVKRSKRSCSLEVVSNKTEIVPIKPLAKTLILSSIPIIFFNLLQYPFLGWWTLTGGWMWRPPLTVLLEWHSQLV